ncbi:MAG TPA: PadR family transcriptional regulator [Solirubrobacteraceae bacterium]
MPDEIDLTPTSYIVLGLLSMAGAATPYDLKQMTSASVGHFWSFPHSQLYAEPERLTRAGYLTQNQESGGRRRKRYTLTDRGREVLKQWLGVPSPDLYELRDLALLKLFLGADTKQLAEAQLQTHKDRLSEYEALREQFTDAAPEGPRFALDLGIRHERETVEFWKEHAKANRN